MSMISQEHPISLTIASAMASHGAAIGDRDPVIDSVHQVLEAKEFVPQVAGALSLIAEIGVLHDGAIWASKTEVFEVFMYYHREWPRYTEAMFWRQVKNAYSTYLGITVEWMETESKTRTTTKDLQKPKRRSLSDARFLHVLNRDGYTCRWCGATEDLTVDHIVPVIRGGTNHLDNLQTLCRPCNSRKGARI